MIAEPFYHQISKPSQKAVRKQAIGEVYDLMRRKLYLDKRVLPDSFVNSIWSKMTGSKGGLSVDEQKRPLLKLLDDTMTRLHGPPGDKWNPRNQPNPYIHEALDAMAAEHGISWTVAGSGTKREGESRSILKKPARKKDTTSESSDNRDDAEKPPPKNRRRIQTRAVSSASDEDSDNPKGGVLRRREEEGMQERPAKKKRRRPQKQTMDSDSDSQTRSVTGKKIFGSKGFLDLDFDSD